MDAKETTEPTEPKGILRKPGEKRAPKGALMVEHNESDPERTGDVQKKRKNLKRQDTAYIKEPPKGVNIRMIHAYCG
jgi:hypothetical protein